MSQLPTIISEPESADADTQNGKDREEGVEKEAETYGRSDEDSDQLP